MKKLLNLIEHKLTLWALKVVRIFITFPDQLTFAGADSSQQLCKHIARMDHKRVLLVTDEMLVDLGMASPLEKTLREAGTDTVLYSGVLPDPTLTMVDEGFSLQHQHECDAILVLGGGSSIDTGKGIAAAATNGDIRKLIGVLKVKKPIMPLFVIPTTAGTGSEVSIAAVLSDPDSHEKLFMADPILTPTAVALDPVLMTGLPKHITAATGLDALTHAVETYIGTTGDKRVKEYSGAAVKMIFKNLPIAYEDGANLDAREALVLASYYAGLSINIASVGNIHAVAHQFGGLYGTPHGMANAIAMPPVLDMSVDAASKPLAELASLIGFGDSANTDLQQAQKFIDELRKLNKILGIPEKLDALQQDDIPSIARAAIKESLQYPLAKLMSQQEMESVLQRILPHSKA